MDENLLNLAFDRYQRMRMMDKIGNFALDRYTGDSQLDRQEKMLSILAKKRMLGIPDSSDEYEDSINGSSSLWSSIGPSLGNKALSKIPEPFSLTPHYKVAHSVADMLPSSLSNIAKAGSKYGSRLGALGRAALYL